MTDLIAANTAALPVDTSGPTCRYCGCSPAVKVNFRQHRGIILLLQFLKEEGPFCRDCGLATFRTMTSRTLVQGWWNWASFLINPWVLVMNGLARRRVMALTPPRPATDGSSSAPLVPGKSVWRRPTIAGGLVPVVVIGFFALVAVASGPDSLVGQCIDVTKGDKDVELVDCTDRNDGQIFTYVDTKDGCPSEAIGSVSFVRISKRGVETPDYGGKFFCVK